MVFLSLHKPIYVTTIREFTNECNRLASFYNGVTVAKQKNPMQPQIPQYA